MKTDLIARALGYAAAGRERNARTLLDTPDPFADALRERRMGAWRGYYDERGILVAQAGKRVPDRVVERIPGVPDDGPHTVVASGRPITSRRKR